MEPKLVLASASPRRARILRDLGITFRVVVSEEDESLRPGEDGAAAVERLARAKAAAVARRETLPVLAADTEVVCDGHILGKPGSAEEAFVMLARLAGRAHEVVTGVCLLGYHVDGRGALFIEEVTGSPSNVAGLPVRLLLRLAREAGLDLGLPPR